jgi:C-terminal processing protease CtpA/Prc
LYPLLIDAFYLTSQKNLLTVLQEIKSKFYGSVKFGINFSQAKKRRNEGYEVYKVLKNSSAEKAGIEVGDRVISVNGQSVITISYKKLSEYFDVPDETEINLTIIKKSGEEKEVTIKKTFVPGEYQDLVKK